MFRKSTPYSSSRVLSFVHLGLILFSLCWAHFNWSVFIGYYRAKTLPIYYETSVWKFLQTPFRRGLIFLLCRSCVVTIISSTQKQSVIHTVHIPSLKELIKHSPRPWLYWSFVIPTERNWYFLTKCNLLEQTSSQVLMKRIQENGHCASPGVMGPVVLCWCLLCMHLVMLTVLISTVPFN